MMLRVVAGSPADHAAEKRRTCPECAPPATGGHRTRKARVFLNDEDVSDRCVEAIPGKLVVLYVKRDGLFHRCRCGNGAQKEIIYGNVRVEERS